ncbi:hypothetical protein L1077_20190 [Pseudoalteromonas luteoviolacea]|uniref:Uncharacterized protein n=1 Tax=Pseudoalteromonas luteoviolacea H33 TaxID=1365251 RepID=A0A167DDM0_9GAMM|nr:hypothetical protein [Pseudoalteromonas luteoviolacea]KZN48705.1 hypothetical protein N476_21055 [Pseudoalteromonas luteoviolacea H33]KZN75460.1 hypothetical protein N477_01730 [Pseudoalteromonas luteoviolacea H33-S]MBQ4878659.1 hypothetical protein [Pseudoalteromonas luteoviolacea]MBQ4907199.1 hypothetical protein [Pseudoalteromonas luteoviolacea]MCF6441760.1 hypothetical protein [Pseudoalteromonas luteoviolacea]
MKLHLKKKAIKKLQGQTILVERTNQIAGGAQSRSPFNCPHTQPAWYCMSYLGCISNRPEVSC